MHSEIDIKFMNLAFKEAEKAKGFVSPNPMVGAVIVKDERVIGRGFHSKSGMPHAEIEALKDCSEDTSGATLYCNLEPCCHSNKQTPPCVPEVIKAGFKRVVICNVDPNPEVSGKGIKALRDSGIEVEVGVLEPEGEKLNEVFFHSILSDTPFIHLKAAQTLDGKIQSFTGDSKWISNESCRKRSHGLRLTYDAILIGRETLNNDNPSLNIRMGVDANGKIPFRVILGDPEKFNWDSYLFREDIEKNIFITTNKIDSLDSLKRKIIEKGQVIENHNLIKSLIELKKLGIQSVLIEGGSKVLSSFLKEGLFNKLTIFQAPKLLGNGEGIFKSTNNLISDSLNLKITNTEVIEGNLMIELRKQCLQE
ncbi:MAG: riboflavin biosynthesis protein RibD [Halobacteriovorax sp.]|nr:riboflavin biosynthesis protein RibD [Halobacteriovorax sp.]|tara:strand:+ start:355689 stop:356783 length:1095 start_codon:yes stop_codon:yes gene_type:complete